MATRIVRPGTAFSKSPVTTKKRPRQHDEKHLAFIRTLPCLVTGTQPVEAAHIRYAAPDYGKREVGGAEKPDDIYVVPLSPEEHRKQHAINEMKYWAVRGIDPVKVAQALWINTGNYEVCEIILRENRGSVASGTVERRT